MAALRADGAADTHLRLSLGRQHHEDHDDEEDASGDGEKAEDKEEGHHGVAESIRELQVFLLRFGDFQIERLVFDYLFDLVDRPLAVSYGVANTAGVRYHDEVEGALAVEPVLECG